MNLRCGAMGICTIALMSSLAAFAGVLKSHVRRHSFVAGQPIPVHLSAVDLGDEAKRVVLQLMWLNRVVVRKELVNKFPLKTQVKFPDLRPGVVADPKIVVAVFNEDGKVIAMWQRKIYVFAANWLGNRNQALRKLDVCVYGKSARETSRLLTRHGVPARPVGSVQAASGKWLICRGVDFDTTPGLFGDLLALASNECSILIIPPFNGQVAIKWDQLDSVCFGGTGEILKQDPRLDIEMPITGFGLETVDGRPGFRFGMQKGRSWLSADVKNGGRVVICGMDLVSQAGKHPAALRIFELLFLKKQNILPHTEETE